ncbi:hypothetical protein ECE50_019340 [Chitinophaga sp. Mgbs1]|uniref:Uncharacterized protein n=1 Tax=Chitinophaga solisilvae TaxID=1233460 RepID=A0A3S1D4A7_9BACT|nr:hypothetical protein [Chitinophaga solisilvae]
MRYFLPAFLLLCCACSKKDQPAPDPVPTGPVTQQEINQWILDSMRTFYLWNDRLPATADAAAATAPYFSSLLNTADPFSQIYNPGNWATYPRFMLSNYGMDFSVIPWTGAPDGAIGVVRFVIPGSNAAKAGFVRGSYFTRINNVAVNSSNIASLTTKILRDATGIFTPAAVNGSTVTEAAPVTVPLGIAATEEAIYAQKIINRNNKKIAYLFYNSFNDAVNNKLIAAFQDFKNQGAAELILDLRYNTGGSLAAAAILSALIAPQVTGETSFVQYTGNSTQGTRKLSFTGTMNYPETGSIIPFSSLQPARLALPRVYILTTHATISAAELVINNLKVYTEVIQIGQTTYGKDKGSITIKDGRGRITWIMQPIAYRLANAGGAGGYDGGITPRYSVDELDSLPLAEIGDEKDALIAKAVSLITGNTRTVPEQVTSQKVYYSSAARVRDIILPH